MSMMLDGRDTAHSSLEPPPFLDKAVGRQSKERTDPALEVVWSIGLQHWTSAEHCLESESDGSASSKGAPGGPRGAPFDPAPELGTSGASQR